MRITFTKSPTGAFKLGYSVGQTADIEDNQAREIVAVGFAVVAEQPELTEAQIKAELTARGIKFAANAKKETLLKLLNA